MMDFIRSFFATVQNNGSIHKNCANADDFTETIVPQERIFNNIDKSTIDPGTDSKESLIEFDDILAEMNGAISDEPITLDEIDDVLNIKENLNEDVKPLEMNPSIDIELMIPKFDITPNVVLQELNSYTNGNYDNNINMLEYKNTHGYFIEIEPNQEVISILSDDSQPNEIDDEQNVIVIESDDDCGYHSSDFEFITEDEAKMDGLIINYNPSMRKKINKTRKVKTIEITSHKNRIEKCTKQENVCATGAAYKNLNPKRKEINCLGQRKEPKKEVHGPEYGILRNNSETAYVGPEISNINTEMNIGPSNFDPLRRIQENDLTTSNFGPKPVDNENYFRSESINKEKANENISGYGPNLRNNNDAEIQRWRSYQLRRKQFRFPDFSYRENHRIPEGEELHRLFHPNFSPMPNRFMENKSIRTSRRMAKFAGIGFDMMMFRQNEHVDDEVKKSAADTRKKILEMYPAENGRRRLRRRF